MPTPASWATSSRRRPGTRRSPPNTVRPATSDGDAAAAEALDYGAVKNVLQALGGRPVRIALMTAIGVTRRGSTHDWKRRSERLVRANDYTIVRPGWFDYNDDDQLEITMLQGDTRHAGSPADGVIARHQIARVLVDSLASDGANRKTFELVAERERRNTLWNLSSEPWRRTRAARLTGYATKETCLSRPNPSLYVGTSTG